MSWLVQQYEGEVHVLPDTDAEPHVLAGDCWCAPKVAVDMPLVSHRDELERVVI